MEKMTKNNETTLSNTNRYSIKYNALISQSSLSMVIALAQTLNETKYLAVLEKNLNHEGFMKFNEKQEVDLMLCPFHNDHTLEYNYSMKFDEQEGLFCWICKKNINLNNFLNNMPKLRINKGNSDLNSIPLFTFNEYCEAYNELLVKYGNFENFMNLAIEQNPLILQKYHQFIYSATKHYNIEETRYLTLLNAIANTHYYDNDITTFFATRGFINPYFIKKLKPFLMGRNIDEVKNNLIHLFQTNQDLNLVFNNNNNSFVQYIDALNLFKPTLSQTYSILENRIGIPIENNYHEIINLDLRTLAKDVSPKYLFLAKTTTNAIIQTTLNKLNISNTNYFGFENEIDYTNHIIIGEGIYDVISLNYVFSNAICSFSSNLSKAQMEKLQTINTKLHETNQSNYVILSLDNDAISLKSMYENYKKLLQHQVYTKMLIPSFIYQNTKTKDWNEILVAHSQIINPLIQQVDVNDKNYESNFQTVIKEHNALFFSFQVNPLNPEFYQKIEKIISLSQKNAKYLDPFLFWNLMFLAKIYQIEHTEVDNSHFAFLNFINTALDFKDVNSGMQVAWNELNSIISMLEISQRDEIRKTFFVLNKLLLNFKNLLSERTLERLQGFYHKTTLNDLFSLGYRNKLNQQEKALNLLNQALKTKEENLNQKEKLLKTQYAYLLKLCHEKNIDVSELSSDMITSMKKDQDFKANTYKLTKTNKQQVYYHNQKLNDETNNEIEAIPLYLK